MNVFDLFGLPDVHDLADRVLSGDVSTVRTAASAARDAGVRLGAQADTLARERSSVALLWTGDVAVLADAKLRSAEDSVRKQARQVASGADDLYDAGDALDRAQREARRLDGLARALENRLDEALDRIRSIPLIGDFQAEALGLFTDFVAPLRPDSVALSIAMQEILDSYERALTTAGQRLASEPGIVRPDAGPVDVGGDASARRTALFRGVYGIDPVTHLDRMMAEALDGRSGDPTGIDVPARVAVMRIDPVPGAGVVHGSAFIAERSVFGGPESLLDFDGTPGWSSHRGDRRSFDSAAGPHNARASYYGDYERGIVVVRQNTTHADDGTAAVGDPTVGIEQDDHSRIRLRSQATNPLAPGFSEEVGLTVREDIVIDPHGGDGGSASVNGRVSRYPSWEFYQQHPDGSSSTVLQRPQSELGPDGAGPLLNLPRDTAGVGADPGELDRWNREHHPEQTPGRPERELERRLPGLSIGDPWYNNPLPRVPYPSASPDGRLDVPHAPGAG